MHKQKQIEDFDDSFSSDVFTSLLSRITPEQQEQADYKMKLAAKIRKAMKVHGMNQTQFAAAMGEKQVSMISRWLSGTHNFTIETLVAIQRVLGISLLDVETAQSQSSLNIKLTVSSPIPNWAPFNLNQYISDLGGMAATEKNFEYTVEG